MRINTIALWLLGITSILINVPLRAEVDHGELAKNIQEGIEQVQVEGIRQVQEGIESVEEDQAPKARRRVTGAFAEASRLFDSAADYVEASSQTHEALVERLDKLKPQVKNYLTKKRLERQINNVVKFLKSLDQAANPEAIQKLLASDTAKQLANGDARRELAAAASAQTARSSAESMKAAYRKLAENRREELIEAMDEIKMNPKRHGDEQFLSITSILDQWDESVSRMPAEAANRLARDTQSAMEYLAAGISLIPESSK